MSLCVYRINKNNATFFLKLFELSASGAQKISIFSQQQTCLLQKCTGTSLKTRLIHSGGHRAAEAWDSTWKLPCAMKKCLYNDKKKHFFSEMTFNRRVYQVFVHTVNGRSSVLNEVNRNAQYSFSPQESSISSVMWL